MSGRFKPKSLRGLKAASRRHAAEGRRIPWVFVKEGFPGQGEKEAAGSMQLPFLFSSLRDKPHGAGFPARAGVFTGVLRPGSARLSLSRPELQVKFLLL
jgi:hypothetical protein